jgi:DNA invertase Pin-like site-specific DNA recombinase
MGIPDSVSSPQELEQVRKTEEEMMKMMMMMIMAFFSRELVVARTSTPP